MERPKFDRRQVLKWGSALVAGAMLPGGDSAEAQTNRESRERTERFEEEGLYLNIDAFEKFPGNVLVLCANHQEYWQVMTTIRERDRRRSRRGKFKFNIVERGSCVAVSGDIRNYENGSDTGAFNNRTMHVVNEESHSFVADYLPRITTDQGQGFSMVQLRGHTNDMNPLFEQSEKFQGEACFLSMGGCESTQFIQDFYKPERPVSAESRIGTTVNNTQLLMRFFDELGSGKHGSWSEFYLELAHTNPANILGGRVIVPGDPDYRDYV